MPTKQTDEKNSTKCKTPVFRVSFPHVFEPYSGFDGQEAKYSLTMLFPEKEDLSAMKKAVANAANAKWGSKDKWPKNMRTPFRDGSEKAQHDGYEGCIFVAASSKQRPGVVDQKLQPITKDDESFYAGCFARATLNAYAYDTAGNKGVAFGINNLQKVKDGEPFSGRTSAADDFDEIQDDSDNEDNYDSDSL